MFMSPIYNLLSIISQSSLLSYYLSTIYCFSSTHHVATNHVATSVYLLCISIYYISVIFL